MFKINPFIGNINNRYLIKDMQGILKYTSLIKKSVIQTKFHKKQN